MQYQSDVTDFSYFSEYIPRDPVMLSYWFVQNYQLNHEERLHILRLNSALERLKLEYRFLKQASILLNNHDMLLIFFMGPRREKCAAIVVEWK